MTSKIKGNSIQINSFSGFIVFDVQHNNIPPTLSLCILGKLLWNSYCYASDTLHKGANAQKRVLSANPKKKKRENVSERNSHLEKNAMQY